MKILWRLVGSSLKKVGFYMEAEFQNLRLAKKSLRMFSSFKSTRKNPLTIEIWVSRQHHSNFSDRFATEGNRGEYSSWILKAVSFLISKRSFFFLKKIWKSMAIKFLSYFIIMGSHGNSFVIIQNCLFVLMEKWKKKAIGCSLNRWSFCVGWWRWSGRWSRKLWTIFKCSINEW